MKYHLTSHFNSLLKILSKSYLKCQIIFQMWQHHSSLMSFEMSFEMSFVVPNFWNNKVWWTYKNLHRGRQSLATSIDYWLFLAFLFVLSKIIVLAFINDCLFIVSMFVWSQISICLLTKLLDYGFLKSLSQLFLAYMFVLTIH